MMDMQNLMGNDTNDPHNIKEFISGILDGFGPILGGDYSKKDPRFPDSEEDH